MEGKEKINIFFKGQQQFFDKAVPSIVAETATEYYKEAFKVKAWDGKAWQGHSKSYNPRGGSLMVKSGILLNSIRPVKETPEVVEINAGNSKTPYAQIHNEGGTIVRNPRSETFKRNRSSRGRRAGKFKRGTTAGQGFTFKKTTINMPRRQYMGYAVALRRRMITRFKQRHNQLSK